MLRWLFAGQSVNIFRQGLICISAVFIPDAIFHGTGLIGAQPAVDVLCLILAGGLYFRFRAKYQSTVLPPREQKPRLHIGVSWVPLSILSRPPGARSRSVGRAERDREAGAVIARQLGSFVRAALGEAAASRAGKGDFCGMERLKLRNCFRTMKNTLTIARAGHGALENRYIF